MLNLRTSNGLAVLAALVAGVATQPARAAGDLLVAPTRIVLDGARGTEVIINNIGTETATYRISLELRRMLPDGRLADVGTPTAAEAQTVAMIAYAPRRVTLPPNQPQAIRIGVRAPQGLADGEYRAHMLFRAIPDAKRVTTASSATRGIAIALTPIYGVTIPIIVRRGQLAVTAAIANAKLATLDGRQAVSLDLERVGSRSTFGEVRVLKSGVAKPVVLARGVAVYTELGRRNVVLPVSSEVGTSIAGPATIQYLETGEDGAQRMLAQAQVVLR